MPHGIFLCMMSVLELLKPRLDTFGSTGTFEDMIVQDVDGLRRVGKGFDRRRKVTAGTILTGTMNAGNSWEAESVRPPLTKSIALCKGAGRHLLHNEERVLSRKVSINRLDEWLGGLFVVILFTHVVGSHRTMTDGRH